MKKTHGLTTGSGSRKYHPVYKAWQNMVQRCTNPSLANYHRYGGRGVKVCKRWMTSSNFVNDMLLTWFEGATIDRKNNEGNYTLANCRWVDRPTSMRNTSRVTTVTWKKKEYCLTDFFKLGVCKCSFESLRRRLKQGVPLEQAIQPAFTL